MRRAPGALFAVGLAVAPSARAEPAAAAAGLRAEQITAETAPELLIGGLDAEPNRALLVPASDGVTRAIDFDAIEVMNGRDWDQYLRTCEVWYSLLRQGLRRTGTGNSDSHGPDEIAAYPRNYVAVDRAAAFADPARLDAALRAGDSFFTTGSLLLRFTANGAASGETASAPGGRVRVEIVVGAAPFVPVDEVRLLLDGRVVGRFLLAADDASGPVRFEREVAVALRRDGFLTLEAGAPLEADAGARRRLVVTAAFLAALWWRLRERARRA